MWVDLGFAVEDGTCWVGGIAHRLGAEGKGVTAWSIGEIDGLAAVRDAPTLAVSAATGLGSPSPPSSERLRERDHRNGVIALDHLVVGTPDLARTVSALEAAGLELRRTRESDTYGAPMRQAFFKAGGTIIEVVGGAEPTGDGPARFFGLAWTVADLDETAAYFGDRLHPAKDAVQPGRMIATLDKAAGSTVRMAFMSK